MIGPFRASRTKACGGYSRSAQRVLRRRVNGGVWKTMTTAARGIPFSTISRVDRSGAIRGAPSNSNVIYVGSGEGLQRPISRPATASTSRSTAGKTWTHLGLRERASRFRKSSSIQRIRIGSSSRSWAIRMAQTWSGAFSLDRRRSDISRIYIRTRIPRDRCRDGSGDPETSDSCSWSLQVQTVVLGLRTITTSIARLFSSLYKIFEMSLRRGQRKRPRSTFAPYGWPMTATKSRFGSFGSTRLRNLLAFAKPEMRPRLAGVDRLCRCPSPVERSGRCNPSPLTDQ